jgi:hypothetical protein
MWPFRGGPMAGRIPCDYIIWRNSALTLPHGRASGDLPLFAVIGLSSRTHEHDFTDLDIMRLFPVP